jgi:hypothetical protein
VVCIADHTRKYIFQSGRAEMSPEDGIRGVSLYLAFNSVRCLGCGSPDISRESVTFFSPQQNW